MAHRQQETSQRQLQPSYLIRFLSPDDTFGHAQRSTLNVPVMTGTALTHNPFLQLTVIRLSKQSPTLRGTPNDVMTGEQ